jgi:hypothetical protein
LFAYANNHIMEKEPAFYANHSLPKFGAWMESAKKRKHQELNELAGAGQGKKLLKAFNHCNISCTLYVIFCTGGIDFVGGYTYYNFLNAAQGSSKVNLKGIEEHKQEGSYEREFGEQVHELIFKGGIKFPANWAAMMQYFA